MLSDEDILLLSVLLRKRNVNESIGSIHTVHRSILYSCTDKEMTGDSLKFQPDYRMSREAFEIVLSKVGPSITKSNTKFREAITVKEKLISLRYI